MNIQVHGKMKMSKVKGMLEKDMMENPELYADSELHRMYEDYDFWMQCRKEELLEREGKPTIKLIRKGKHEVKRSKGKSNKV